MKMAFYTQNLSMSEMAMLRQPQKSTQIQLCERLRDIDGRKYPLRDLRQRILQCAENFDRLLL